MTCKNCSQDCPFSLGSGGNDFGCLPSAFDIVMMRQNHGKTWACHSDHSKPCVGAIEHMKENNLEYKVIDKQLITLDCDWSKYIDVKYNDNLENPPQMCKNRRK